MKKLVQKILGCFGVRLIRVQYARKYLPRPDIDNIEIVAKLYSLTKDKIKVLQIGACDGVTSDSIYPYIRSGYIDAYLVEPSKTNYNKLAQFYEGIKNVTLINVAIADKDGILPLYSIKDEGRWKDNGWARQLASFYKEHLLKHNIRESEIQKEEVNCLTLQSVIKNYKINDLDILLVDTEGYDGVIVKMALDQHIRPNFIVFENAQLVQNYSQEDLNLLYMELSRNGYAWVHDRINTMAIRKDFFKQR